MSCIDDFFSSWERFSKGIKDSPDAQKLMASILKYTLAKSSDDTLFGAFAEVQAINETTFTGDEAVQSLFTKAENANLAADLQRVISFIGETGTNKAKQKEFQTLILGGVSSVLDTIDPRLYQSVQSALQKASDSSLTIDNFIEVLHTAATTAPELSAITALLTASAVQLEQRLAKADANFSKKLNMPFGELDATDQKDVTDFNQRTQAMKRRNLAYLHQLHSMLGTTADFSREKVSAQTAIAEGLSGKVVDPKQIAKFNKLSKDDPVHQHIRALNELINPKSLKENSIYKALFARLAENDFNPADPDFIDAVDFRGLAKETLGSVITDTKELDAVANALQFTFTNAMISATAGRLRDVKTFSFNLLRGYGMTEYFADELSDSMTTFAFSLNELSATNALGNIKVAQTAIAYNRQQPLAQLITPAGMQDAIMTLVQDFENPDSAFRQYIITNPQFKNFVQIMELLPTQQRDEATTLALKQAAMERLLYVVSWQWRNNITKTNNEHPFAVLARDTTFNKDVDTEKAGRALTVDTLENLLLLRLHSDPVKARGEFNAAVLKTLDADRLGVLNVQFSRMLDIMKTATKPEALGQWVAPENLPAFDFAFDFHDETATDENSLANRALYQSRFVGEAMKGIYDAFNRFTPEEIDLATPETLVEKVMGQLDMFSLRDWELNPFISTTKDNTSFGSLVAASTLQTQKAQNEYKPRLDVLKRKLVTIFSSNRLSKKIKSVGSLISVDMVNARGDNYRMQLSIADLAMLAASGETQQELITKKLLTLDSANYGTADRRSVSATTGILLEFFRQQVINTPEKRAMWNEYLEERNAIYRELHPLHSAVSVDATGMPAGFLENFTALIWRNDDIDTNSARAAFGSKTRLDVNADAKFQDLVTDDVYALEVYMRKTIADYHSIPLRRVVQQALDLQNKMTVDAFVRNAKIKNAYEQINKAMELQVGNALRTHVDVFNSEQQKILRNTANNATQYAKAFIATFGTMIKNFSSLFLTVPFMDSKEIAGALSPLPVTKDRARYINLKEQLRTIFSNYVSDDEKTGRLGGESDPIWFNSKLNQINSWIANISVGAADRFITNRVLRGVLANADNLTDEQVLTRVTDILGRTQSVGGRYYKAAFLNSEVTKQGVILNTQAVKLYQLARHIARMAKDKGDVARWAQVSAGVGFSSLAYVFLNNFRFSMLAWYGAALASGGIAFAPLVASNLMQGVNAFGPLFKGGGFAKGGVNAYGTPQNMVRIMPQALNTILGFATGNFAAGSFSGMTAIRNATTTFAVALAGNKRQGAQKLILTEAEQQEIAAYAKISKDAAEAAKKQKEQEKAIAALSDDFAQTVQDNLDGKETDDD